MDKRTEQMFNLILNKLDSMDQRFDTIEKRLDKIEERLDKIEERLDRVEARLDRVEARLDVVENDLREFKAETRENFKSLDNKIDMIYVHLKSEIDRIKRAPGLNLPLINEE